ncbi:hypothetical protein, partial [Acidocella sp. KAb 2-4]|uniref:hypothetical protein n=1 Tax=Acidocella sp. KAb 2-4 TaxID=2885158 RepID=UPI001D066F7C
RAGVPLPFEVTCDEQQGSKSGVTFRGRGCGFQQAALHGVNVLVSKAHVPASKEIKFHLLRFAQRSQARGVKPGPLCLLGVGLGKRRLVCQERGLAIASPPAKLAGGQIDNGAPRPCSGLLPRQYLGQ